jgi:hypothetical protein
MATMRSFFVICESGCCGAEPEGFVLWVDDRVLSESGKGWRVWWCGIHGEFGIEVEGGVDGTRWIDT